MKLNEEAKRKLTKSAIAFTFAMSMFTSQLNGSVFHADEISAAGYTVVTGGKNEDEDNDGDSDAITTSNDIGDGGASEGDVSGGDDAVSETFRNLRADNTHTDNAY